MNFPLIPQLGASDLLTGQAASAVLSPYMVVFYIAFLVTFFTTPLMRMLALHNGVVDMPDFKRKAHLAPIAYLGGIAIFLGWLAAVSACYFLEPGDNRLRELGVASVPFPFAIVIGAAVITLTGVIDDVYGVSPRVKVGGQLIAAAALATQDVGSELVIRILGVGGISFPHMELFAYVVGAALIAIFVLGGCNAVNLLDGMDGLASGTTAIAAGGLLFISIFVAIGVSNPLAEPPGIDIMTSPVRIVLCLALLGAVLGFLPYNFNPANIFMGDTGSLLLGFLCVSNILLLAHAPGSGPALVMAGLIVFALPITDTTLAIVRRKMAGQPLFSPDNEHLHHQLRKAGLSVKQTVLTLYGLSFLFAILGCSMVFLRWRYGLAIFLFVFGFVVVSAYKSAQNRILAQKLAESQAAEHAAEAAAAEVASTEPITEPATSDGVGGEGRGGTAGGLEHGTRDTERSPARRVPLPTPQQLSI